MDLWYDVILTRVSVLQGTVLDKAAMGRLDAELVHSIRAAVAEVKFERAVIGLETFQAAEAAWAQDSSCRKIVYALANDFLSKYLLVGQPTDWELGVLQASCFDLICQATTALA